MRVCVLINPAGSGSHEEMTPSLHSSAATGESQTRTYFVPLTCYLVKCKLSVKILCRVSQTYAWYSATNWQTGNCCRWCCHSCWIIESAIIGGFLCTWSSIVGEWMCVYFYELHNTCDMYCTMETMQFRQLAFGIEHIACFLSPVSFSMSLNKQGL